MSDFSGGMVRGLTADGGINNLFRGFAMGDAIRQKAELEAALKSSQAYHHGMAGNVQRVKAEDAMMSLENRRGVDDQIASNPEMPEYHKRLLLAHKLIGGGDIQKFAHAGGDFQKQNSIDNIQSGKVDPIKTGQAYFAVSGKAPFANAKADGYSLNQMTGDQIEANPVVAKLYQQLETAKTKHQNASAGAAGALAGLRGEQRKQIQVGNVMDGTDADGKPISYTYGTSGNVQILPGVAPLHKSGGADAAFTKRAAEIAKKVIDDPLIAPDQKEAEITKRLEIFDRTIRPGKKPAEQKPAEQKPEGPDMTKAEQIKADFKAGKITREQARQQLQTLGFK